MRTMMGRGWKENSPCNRLLLTVIAYYRSDKSFQFITSIALFRTKNSVRPNCETNATGRQQASQKQLLCNNKNLSSVVLCSKITRLMR